MVAAAGNCRHVKVLASGTGQQTWILSSSQSKPLKATTTRLIIQTRNTLAAAAGKVLASGKGQQTRLLSPKSKEFQIPLTASTAYRPCKILAPAAGKVLASGKGQQTRPMMGKVRSALFDMLLALSSPNGAQFPATARWLDLYAGEPTAVSGCRPQAQPDVLNPS